MSSPRRLGLPEALRMRHDTHFVDQLGRPGGVPVGRLIPLEDIDPNPNQPRQALGDLSELVASIREKGVLEPILVRPRGSRFQIIAGERRYRAASELALAEIPCIVRETERRRDDGARADREPAAQGPQRVRRSGRPEGARGNVRLHARAHGGEDRTQPHVDHGDAFDHRDARRRARALSAGRHSLEVIASANRSSIRQAENDRTHRTSEVDRAAHAKKRAASRSSRSRRRRAAAPATTSSTTSRARRPSACRCNSARPRSPATKSSARCRRSSKN